MKDPEYIPNKKELKKSIDDLFCEEEKALRQYRSCIGDIDAEIKSFNKLRSISYNLKLLLNKQYKLGRD